MAYAHKTFLLQNIALELMEQDRILRKLESTYKATKEEELSSLAFIIGIHKMYQMKMYDEPTSGKNSTKIVYIIDWFNRYIDDFNKEVGGIVETDEERTKYRRTKIKNWQFEREAQ